MKTILHISASARGEESASYRLSRRMIAQLREQHPDARVVSRDLYAEPVPHIDSLYASTLARLPGGAPHAQGLSSLAWSDLLIEELKAADAVVIATPMHNFTVPSVLKAWLDHVVRIGVTFNATPQGKVGTLPDRPVYIAVSSGGPRSGERARQPDFLEPYLRAILATIGLTDLHFV
ncbi:flavodoxin family protein [Pseudoduganella sp. FT25W]|uniref:FMN dependent NADH:quinone oxidoreductase n=1 Tax=Duganella alba TaxID=2666081 RepID=A0A6L5QCP6_9BURK|nr:NAD(P)H-dependent oxidoreductase [Duganella alba]MRX06871.1 flavodoxin family protein [Duganella alba]MRX16232.1 flavodoxin family protein [Duganella alba]